MTETAYELLALGLRYWFVFLIVMSLLRAAWLMYGDHRAYQRLLRQLPDAGLVGEVVDLATNLAQPLPREGMIGSGRGCDIRYPGLRRREMEFVFRPGMGLRLIPAHARHRAMLDGEYLNKADAFALHGTILELGDRHLRFRLFAGLDLPQRVAPVAVHPVSEWETNGFEPGFGAVEPLTLPPDIPPAAPPAPEMEMTWQFAPLPPELLEPPTPPRRRRSDRQNGEGGDA